LQRGACGAIQNIPNEKNHSLASNEWLFGTVILYIRLRRVKTPRAIVAVAFPIGRWRIISGGIGCIHQMQVSFEFHIEAAVFHQDVSFQVSDADRQRFQQGAHDPFEKILTGVALVFFFYVDVTIVKHDL
jgi:hypothetical protein